MESIAVDQVVAGLCAIAEEDFAVAVYDYVKSHPVDIRSLEPYLFFSANNYTRNLIFKNELFELLAICWEAGQASPIHNHHGQNCWMAMPLGKLRVQNFRLVEQDDRIGHCELEPTEIYEISKTLPTRVNPDEPIHRVMNVPEFHQRAVSLHIYSKPFDRCLVYSIAEKECKEVRLHYTSEYGKLCEEEKSSAAKFGARPGFSR